MNFATLFELESFVKSEFEKITIDDFYFNEDQIINNIFNEMQKIYELPSHIDNKEKIWGYFEFLKFPTKQIESELKDLEQNNYKLDSSIQYIKIEIDKKVVKTTSLENQIVALNQKENDLKIEIENIEKAIESMIPLAKVSDFSRKYDLERDLSELKTKLHYRNNDLKDCLDKKLTIPNEIAKLKQEIAILEEKQIFSNNEIEEVNTLIDSKKKEKELLFQKFSQKEYKDEDESKKFLYSFFTKKNSNHNYGSGKESDYFKLISDIFSTKKIFSPNEKDVIKILKNVFHSEPRLDDLYTYEGSLFEFKTIGLVKKDSYYEGYFNKAYLQIISLWLVFNKILKQNPELIKGRSYFMQISSGIFVEIIVRNLSENLKEKGFRVNYFMEGNNLFQETTPIFSGYSDSGFKLPIGLYILKDGYAIEIFFHSSALLLDNPLTGLYNNQIISDKERQSDIAQEEEYQRLMDDD